MKIGFIDHHLNNFHANKFLSLLRGPLQDRGALVTAAWESHPSGDDWCQRQNVPRGATLEAVVEQSDALFILAPDNIDTHLDLCHQVFPAGKPVVVDKLLAPDYVSARKIVNLAGEYGCPLFCASGLRFADEIQAVKQTIEGPPSAVFARGMGEWQGYGVHTLSMAVAIRGTGARKLVDTGAAGIAAVTLEYQDGDRCWLDVREASNHWDSLPWSFGFRAGGAYHTGVIRDFNAFYKNLISEALSFLETGISSIATDEMLQVVEILESAEKSRTAGGVWIDL